MFEIATNATSFSQKKLGEKIRLVIDAMKSMPKVVATQADVRKHIGKKLDKKMSSADVKAVERLMKTLVNGGVLVKYKENWCKFCGRPLREGLFYSLSEDAGGPHTSPLFKTYTREGVVYEGGKPVDTKENQQRAIRSIQEKRRS